MSANAKRHNPYVGPRALTEGEAIFGRDREERQLFQLLVARRIALLHSPSGAGKTSLVQAGLIPQLKADGFRVLPIARLNKKPPDDGDVANELNRYHYSLLLSLEERPEGQFDPALSRLSLVEYLQPHFGTDEEPQLLVLIIDQLEEVLNIDPTDTEAKEAFFIELGKALRNPRLWALFVIREDYLGALEPYARAIPTRLANTFRLDLLDSASAADAIAGPARAQGVDFTRPAVQGLVDDLRCTRVQQPDGSLLEQRGPYVEPVHLQVICRRLWTKLPALQTEITDSDLQDIGDVDQSLAAYFAACISEVAAIPDVNVRERHIRQWIQNKLITRDGVRLPVLMGQETTEGLDNRILRELQNNHLLRADKRAGVTWYELAHDRLVTPIRKDNAAWFTAHLSALQRQSQRWLEEDKPDYLLLRGDELNKAVDWARRHDAELSADDRAFLATCLREQQREEEARQARIQLREAKHQQELAEEQRKLAEEQRQRAEEAEAASKKLQRRRNIALLFAAGSLLFAIAAMFLFWQSSKNAAERAAAESTAVASESTAIAALVVARAESANARAQQAAAQGALATNEAVIVAILGTEEARVSTPAPTSTPEVNGEQPDTEETPLPEETEVRVQPTLTEQTTPVVEVSATPPAEIESMDYLALQLDNIRVLQQTLITAPRVGAAPTNGPIVFDSSRAGGTNLFIMQADGSEVRQLTNTTGYVGEADISPDGTWLSYEERVGNTVLLRTMRLDGSQPEELVEGRQPDWSPDGGAIAYESTIAPIQLWSVPVADGKPAGEPERLTNLRSNARAPSWSPDGQQIVFMIEVDGVWQLAVLDLEESTYRVITEGTTSKRFPVWSPDGELIVFNTLDAAGDPDQIWIVTPSGEGMQQLTQESFNGRPSWSPDGRSIVFNRYVDGRWLIHTMNRDGSNLVALTAEGHDQRANWGP